MVRRFLNAYGELVLVLGLGLLAQLELWLDSTWEADRDRLALVALAMSALLLLRLRAPLLTLLLQIGGMQVMSTLNSVENNDPMTMVIFALVAVYTAGAHTRGLSLLAAAVAVAGMTAIAIVEDGESLNVSGFLFFGFLIGAPFLAGIVIRRRRERERVLLHEREEKARVAVLEERARIARELHDVVAHAISVIVLQARGGRRSPEDAGDAFDAIESTATGALGEMRRLVGMLRREDEELARAPQPSLANLDLLAASVREAGLPVTVAVEGDPVELPPGVDLAAFRIVQEGLTNALKHAGPASARVVLRYGPETVELEIADDGAGGGNGDGAVGGHGLVGMRERISLYGGELESGPRPEGGYAVRAMLPL